MTPPAGAGVDHVSLMGCGTRWNMLPKNSGAGFGSEMTVGRIMVELTMDNYVDEESQVTPRLIMTGSWSI